MPRKSGTAWKIDISGQSFNDWYVISRIAGSMWLCQCKCGNSTAVSGSSLKLGKSKCCKRCSQKRHGMEGTKIYNIWAGMKQRCQNQNYHSYEYYGGRGIKVSSEWQNFETFYHDMGIPPLGMSLDRKDNNGNYCKENCRWATSKQQMQNRRNSKIVEYNGISKSLMEWSIEIGVKYSTMKSRLYSGWSIEKILTTK